MKTTLSLFLALCSFLLAAGEPRIAFLGDSITFDGKWATEVEANLRLTPTYRNAEIVNFGLSSETASGLSEPNHANGQFPRPCIHERLQRILDAYKPTLVIACYGMNDGIYLPLDPSRLAAYTDGITRLKSTVEKSGASILFITPPVHSPDKDTSNPNRYDLVLDAQSQWLKSQPFTTIDIRPDLRSGIAALKNTTPTYIYASDNIHPGKQGHHLIAQAILKQLFPILKIQAPTTPPSPQAIDLLYQRHQLLKLAWLSHTGYKRPGIPTGLPLDQANSKASPLLSQFFQNQTSR